MPVTPAESRIMEALWSRGPLSREDITAAVAAEQGWGPATVKTLIQRLIKRGALQSQRDDGRVRYAPLLSRDDYVAAESQSLLDRLFGGQLSPLVAHFAEHRALSKAEIERLKALIADLDPTQADSSMPDSAESGGSKCDPDAG